MWGAWILLLGFVTLGGCKELLHDTEYVDYIYYDDYAAPDVAIQENTRKTRQSSSSASVAAPPQLKPRRPGTATKKSKPRPTTPVPIIKDIRRIDPVSGAFYYHYEGGDGSMKHEVRFPNGTVLGNFTFVKKNGELETQTYHHGMGTNIVENDNGDYELHRHLEEAYVHQSGPDPVETLFPEDAALQPNSVRVQSHRPVTQSRPVASPRERVRGSRPRPIVLQQQPQRVFSAPQSVPLDYHDTDTAFSFQDESRAIFNPNTVDVVPNEFQAQASSLQPVVVVESLPNSQFQQSEPVYEYVDYVLEQ